MLAFLTPITAPLGISNPDFVVAAAGVLAFAIFAFLWSSKAYSAFFGAVVGIGIYVVLQTLLGPAYISPETAKVLSPSVSTFLIGSSAYLIPILFFLGPINGGLNVKGAENPLIRTLESGFVAVFAMAVIITSGFGFMAQSYVFTADTAFTLLRDSPGFTAFVAGSKALTFLASHMQSVVVSAVLFGIYKAFFAEIVGATVAAVFSTLLKRMKGGWNGGHPESGHANHDDGHGHEDFEDEHEDPHGHGGHGHAHH